MRIRAAILVLIMIAVVAACERSTTWPPSQAQLSRVFDRQKATLLMIEQEMVADGLLRMSPAVFSEVARNLIVPKLPSEQSNKYVTLFERTEMYLDVIRTEDSTDFELLIQNVGPRLYLSRFVHTAHDRSLSKCAPDMQQMACGSCAIRLESEWLLEYYWFPANPNDEASLCGASGPPIKRFEKDMNE